MSRLFQPRAFRWVGPAVAAGVALLLARPTLAQQDSTLPPVRPRVPAAPLPLPVQPGRGDTLYLSVEAAVERAMRVADEIRLAAAQVEAAEAQILTARGSVFPQLRLNAGYTRNIASARGQAVSSILNQQNTYTVTGAFTQPLFQGGREWAALRAAGRVRGAARLSAEEQRSQTTLAVQRAYLDALFAGRLVEIQQTNYQLASDRLAQVEQFQSAGRSARYDVLRARVERANLEPLVIQAANDRELALLELKRLLDIPAEQPVALTTSVDPVGVQTMLASYSRDTVAAGDGGGDRASVRAAELTAQARRLGVRIARADLLPSVSVFLNWGYQAFPQSGFPTGFGRVTTIPCPDGSPASCRPTIVQNGGFFSDRVAGVQLTWALFDGLRTKGNIDLAQAQARQAEIQLDLERERVSIEVARARAELSRAKALFEARRQNAGEADEAFRLASLRFTRGLSTQLDVTDAQYALLTARTNEARAVYDLYLAQAALAAALGRPIPLPPASNVAPVRTSSNSSGSER